MSDLQRRRSGTMSSSEKITGVKNSQAEKMLVRMVAQFKTELRQKDRLLQGECFRLQYDRKMMGLDKKRSDLEHRKRLDPQGDHSHAERAVTNIEKYCTQSSDIMPYTDRSLRFKVRTQSLPDAETPVVAAARGTLRQQDMNVALEKKKATMYSFLGKPKHHPAGGHGDVDEVDSQHHDNQHPITSEKLPKFSSAMKGKRGKHGEEDVTAEVATGGAKSVSISLPGVSAGRKPGTAPAPTASGATRAPPHLKSVGRAATITTVAARTPIAQKLMCRNPVVKEAIEKQRHEGKGGKRPAAKSASAVDERLPGEEIVAASAARSQRPVTQGTMRSACREVQKRVNAFCAHMENTIIDIKTADFEQSVAFKQDRSAVYKEYTEEMKKYHRQNEYKDKEKFEKEEAIEEVEQKRQLDAKLVLLRLSAVDKDRLIMTNIGKGARGERERKRMESGGKPQRGIPNAAAERSQRHTPTAKLQRMLEASNRPVGGPPPAAAAKKTAAPQTV